MMNTNSGYVTSGVRPPSSYVRNSYQEDIPDDFDWSYFKTASCILRIIVFVLLLVCVILMGQAVLLNLVIELDSGSEDTDYFSILKTLRICYLTFGSFLMLIQVTKIALNIARYGDYRHSKHTSAKAVNITINIFEGLIFVGLVATAATILISAFYLIFDPACATALGLVVPCGIVRAAIGCVECCCLPPVHVTQQVVIVYPQPNANK